MRTVLFILLPLIILATEIRIASYNVENLFDNSKQGKEYAAYIPSPNGWNTEAYHTKLENISTVIASLNPDIIALQEIENRHVLDALITKCKHKRVLYNYSAFGENDSRSAVGVALLSKYPLTYINQHKVYLSKSGRTRNILECEVDTPLGKLRLIAVHFPSKRRKESYRVKAAQAVKSIIDTLDKNCEYVILGDFNSNHDEAVRLLSEKMDDSNGISGINHILQTSSSPIGDTFSLNSVYDLKNHGDHYNPWYEKEGVHQYSYRYQGDLTTLDHILLPRTLFDGKGIEYKYNSFSHYTMNSLLTKNITPYRWESKRVDGTTVHYNRGYSDHLPIFLTLTSTPFRFTTQKHTQTGAFETGNDGWIIKSPHFLGERTRFQACDGDYSFHITGQGKRNGAMASVTGIIPKGMKQATIALAGTGEYAIRIKKNNEKKWYYLVGTKLQSSGSKSYTTLPKEKWVQRKIPLYPFNVGDTVKIELRYRGNIYQDIYLDKSSLNGWFRPQEKSAQSVPL